MQQCKLDNRTILKCRHLLNSFECWAAPYPPEFTEVVYDLQYFLAISETESMMPLGGIKLHYI